MDSLKQNTQPNPTITPIHTQHISAQSHSNATRQHTQTNHPSQCPHAVQYQQKSCRNDSDSQRYSEESTLQPQPNEGTTNQQENWVQSKAQHEFDPSKMQYYLASGHVTNFKFLGDKIHKKAKQSELNFYKNNSFEEPYNPKCFGIEGQYVVLENLLYDVPQPAVIDIKLGRCSSLFKMNASKQQLQERKIMLSSSQTLGFRVSGYVTPQTKEHSLLIKDESAIKQILMKAISQTHQPEVLDFLRKLKKDLEQHNRVYQATSLLIVANLETIRVKWIDFTYWKQSDHPDPSLIEGISNLYKMVEELY